MKKLMIAAAIVCAAAMAQAAGFSWKSANNDGGVLYDGTEDSTWYAANPNGTDPVSTGTTLYLFAVANSGGTSSTAGALAAKALFNAMTADGWTGLANYTGSASWKYTTALGTDSKITTAGIEGDAYKGTFDFFFAAEGKNADGEDVFYISNVLKNKAYGGTGATGVQYTDLAQTSIATFDTAEGWQGAGVYQTVPEPTSGLLLLLGVAGLALRRRRA